MRSWMDANKKGVPQVYMAYDIHYVPEQRDAPVSHRGAPCELPVPALRRQAVPESKTKYQTHQHHQTRRGTHTDTTKQNKRARKRRSKAGTQAIYNSTSSGGAGGVREEDGARNETEKNNSSAKICKCAVPCRAHPTLRNGERGNQASKQAQLQDYIRMIPRTDDIRMVR